MLGVLPPLGAPGGSLKDAYPTVKDAAAAGSRRRAPEALGKARLGKESAKRPLEETATHALVEELLENSQQCGSQTLPSGAPQTDFKEFNRSLCQQDSKRPRTVRTFEDIATQRQARGPLRELPSNVDYLPPPLAAPALAGGGTCTQTAAERELPASVAAPLDWSLKTTARFSSRMPFAICEEAAEASSREVAEVHRRVASCSGTHMLSLRQQYLAALLSFQHPQAPRAMPPGARTRGPDAEALARRQDWHTAFCSLYDNFRNGQCSAFYYVAPEGSGKGCVAFFGAAGVGGQRRMHALLTHSTAGTRALLQQGLGLGFAAPLMPGGSEAAAEDAPGSSGSTQSMLAFEGALRVHGLFDFLLNESWRLHGDECDVPLLLAPTQFLHGSLRAHQPKVLGFDDRRDSSKALHRLELRGLLPPWVLDRLAGIFAVTQDGDFTLMCDTHTHTLSLNWQPSSSAAGTAAKPLDDHAAREGGCLDSEEVARWQQAVPGLSCNVVRELRCEGGTFTARLSNKSAARLG